MTEEMTETETKTIGVTITHVEDKMLLLKALAGLVGDKKAALFMCNHIMYSVERGEKFICLLEGGRPDGGTDNKIWEKVAHNLLYGKEYERDIHQRFVVAIDWEELTTEVPLSPQVIEYRRAEKWFETLTDQQKGWVILLGSSVVVG